MLIYKSLDWWSIFNSTEHSKPRILCIFLHRCWRKRPRENEWSYNLDQRQTLETSLLPARGLWWWKTKTSVRIHCSKRFVYSERQIEKSGFVFCFSYRYFQCYTPKFYKFNVNQHSTKLTDLTIFKLLRSQYIRMKSKIKENLLIKRYYALLDTCTCSFAFFCIETKYIFQKINIWRAVLSKLYMQWS